MSVTGLGSRDPPGGGGPGGAVTPRGGRGAAGRHSGRRESGGAGPGGQPNPVAVMQVGIELKRALTLCFSSVGGKGTNSESVFYAPRRQGGMATVVRI